MYNIRIIDSIKTGPSIKNEFEKGLSIYQLFSEIQTLNNTLQTFIFSDLEKLSIQYLLFLSQSRNKILNK